VLRVVLVPPLTAFPRSAWLSRKWTKLVLLAFLVNAQRVELKIVAPSLAECTELVKIFSASLGDGKSESLVH
jgi:hypothetical protein